MEYTSKINISKENIDKSKANIVNNKVKIIINSLINALKIYTIAYILCVIYKFEFYNPFLWILDIPQWKGSYRLVLLGYLISFSYGNYIKSKKKINSLEEHYNIDITISYVVAFVLMLILSDAYCSGRIFI